MTIFVFWVVSAESAQKDDKEVDLDYILYHVMHTRVGKALTERPISTTIENAFLLRGETLKSIRYELGDTVYISFDGAVLRVRSNRSIVKIYPEYTRRSIDDIQLTGIKIEKSTIKGSGIPTIVKILKEWNPDLFRYLQRRLDEGIVYECTPSRGVYRCALSTKYNMSIDFISGFSAPELTEDQFKRYVSEYRISGRTR
ncbi:MAG: hypothetical protein K2K92_05480 [Duncaniella sp.]|nr:hypothetical protein [Duncaniella sp.]